MSLGFGQFIELLIVGVRGFVHWSADHYWLNSEKRLDAETQQQVRYAWLQLAADIAEEEGL